MKIGVYFTLPEVDPSALAGTTVVVVDPIRATTSIVEALAHGAGGIYPTGSTEDAVRLAASLGREDTLLCGERKGIKVEGFDLGNSPGEFTEEAVGGMKLVMSTTNGTRALPTAAEAEREGVCAFANLSAVAAAVSADDEVIILCAGREDRFAIDDALCAGYVVQKLVEAADEEPDLDDSAQAAKALAEGLTLSRELLEHSAAGRATAEIGLADDLDICSDIDRHDIVPVVHDQAITLAGA